MKKIIVSLVVSVLLTFSFNVSAEEWGGRNTQPNAPYLEEAPIVVLAVPVVPIITDPIGDHFTTPSNAIVDIGVVEGGTDGNDVTIKVNFSADTVMTDVVGQIDLDTDQNPGTGILPYANAFGAAQDIGVDFFLDLFSFPSVNVLDANTYALMGTVTGVITGQSLEITVPLSMLGSDDGNMDVGMVLGNFTEPTDFGPDTGHGSITINAPTGRSVSNDFNGDGKADLIFRNGNTGVVKIWFMDGTTRLSAGSAGAMNPSNWQIQSTSDFNGDGKTDIAWRNLTTGAVKIWLMDGTTKISVATAGGINLNWDMIE